MPTTRVIAAALALSLGLVVVASLALDLHRLQESHRGAVLDDAHAATHVAAEKIARNQNELVAVVRRLGVDLGMGNLPLSAVEPRLAEEVRLRPHITSVAVVFPAEPGAPLVAPAAIRRKEGHRTMRLEQLYDVGASEWFRDVEAHPEPGWHGPFLGPATGQFIAYYCEPWTRRREPERLGHVCGAWSLFEIEAFRQSLPAGRFGYTWLLSREARSLAHPDVDWLRAARTPDQIADELGDPRLREVGALAAAGLAGVVQAVDPLTGREAVMFQEPIATSGWSLVAVVLQDDILAGEPALRRREIDLVVAVLATLAAAALPLLLGGRR